MSAVGADYSCPLCAHRLSESDIARVHFTKKCPACAAALAINAPGALTRSRRATIAGLLGMVLTIGACFVALTALGIDEKTLNSWPAAWQASLGTAVIAGSLLVAYLAQRAQVNAALDRMRRQLPDDGRL